jgi:hypothetical protein
MSRSTYHNFRKQQHRAAGVYDALCELTDLDPTEWPEGRVIETVAYASAKRLFLAGVAAAREGRKVTAVEKRSMSFMLGYKVAGPAVVSAAVDGISMALVAPSKPKDRPPFDDPAPQFWRKLTGKDSDGRPLWGCIDGDEVRLYAKKGKEWENTSTHHGVPMRGCPDWVEDFWPTRLAGDPKKRATVEDLYDTIYNALAEGESEEPVADEHPVIAALWRDIVAGIKAAESGAVLPEGESTLAFRVGYEKTKEAA